MDGNILLVYVVIMALKALWLLTLPTIIIVAACMLWNSVPRWIPSVFIAKALVGAVASTPPFLLLIKMLSTEQYVKMAMPLSVVSGIAGLVFALALLALAIRMKRMSEPSVGGDA